MNAEYLDLIVDVNDSFTEDLQWLTLQIQEIGVLADRILDPIEIDVDVHDGELDTLLGKIAAVQGVDLANIGGVGSGGVSASSGSGGSADDVVPDGGLEKMFHALDDLDVGMTDFYDMLAAVLPLLLNFVAAMPAAIAAVGGLATAALGAAAALGGIAGLGLLGAASQNAGGGMPEMEDFTDVLSDIRDMFFEAFEPLATKLAPMFEKGLSGLERFFNELAARGGALLDFRNEAEAFGDFMIDFLAIGIAKITRFADAMSPVFSAFGDWLEGTDIIGKFAWATRIALGGLVLLGSEIVNILPAVIKLSSGFLIMSGFILSFFDGVGKLIGILPISGRLLGMLVGSFLALTTAMLIAIKVQNIWTGTTIANAITSMGAFIKSVIAGEATLTNYIRTTYASAAATLTLANAIKALLAATGIGLVLVGVQTLVEQFGLLESNISGATDSLKEFERTSNRMEGTGDMGASNMGRDAYVNYTENSMTIEQGSGSSGMKPEDAMNLYNYFSK
jgi:hypothetical protein